MIKVAITGNIASGKTEVERLLQEKSFKVLDTDKVAHYLLLQEPAKSNITSAFKGYDIFEKSDSSQKEEISRLKLGQIVFEDKALRDKLEGILHPLIKEEIEKFFFRNKEERITFVSVPLLFEAKFEKLFDKVMLIYANDEIRLNRLIKRNDLSLEYAKNRLRIQMSQDEKKSLSDYTIYNNDTIENLRKNLDKTLELI